MRCALASFAVVLVTACSAGVGGNGGLATVPDEAGSATDKPDAGSGTVTTAADAGKDAAVNEQPAVLKPRYDITIAGVRETVSQLFVGKDSGTASGHHHPSIQGLFFPKAIPNADP